MVDQFYQVNGKKKDEVVDIVSAFQSYGRVISNEITNEERDEMLKCCCPTQGSCGGMYTANTMAIFGEALGMSVLMGHHFYQQPNTVKILNCY